VVRTWRTSLVRSSLAGSLLVLGVIVALRLPHTVSDESAGPKSVTSTSQPCGFLSDRPALLGLSLPRAQAVARREGFSLDVLRLPSAATRETVIDVDWGAVVSCLSPSSMVPVGVLSGPFSNSGGRLPFATAPPRGKECTETIDFGQDGTLGPIFCPDGRVNVDAWMSYASFYGTSGFGRWARLGPHATETQVISVLRAHQLSLPVSEDLFSLAQAYYGWPHWAGLPECVVAARCP